MDGGRTDTRHPAVLRFAELLPSALPRFEAHRMRRGGDLDHVDPAATVSNRILIGEADWVDRTLREIDAMRHENFAEELEALEKRGRAKELDARIREGLKDPWRASKGGPLREVILTANRSFFDPADGEQTPQSVIAAARTTSAFEAHAVEWLRTRFGDDVVHARADHDETAYHIHAVIMTRTQKVSKRRGRQRLIQPSAHPLIKDYEAAQDDIGEWMSAVGLRRGDRTAEARRRAKEAGLPPPERRKHIPPAIHRAERERGLQKRERDVAEREREATMAEAEADATLAVAEAFASGAVGVNSATGREEPRPESVPKPAFDALARRARRSESAAHRARSAFTSAYRNITAAAVRDAEAAVEKRWSEAFAAIDRGFASLKGFRDKMIALLPVRLRRQFAATTDEDLGRASDELHDIARKRPVPRRDEPER